MSIVPLAQHCLMLPLAAWILIVEHVTGEKLMLQPFDIGEPVHVLPTVFSVPTFVESQKMSQPPWHACVSDQLLMPTWLMHAGVPLHTMYSPTFWKLWMFAEDQMYVEIAHGLVVKHPV